MDCIPDFFFDFCLYYPSCNVYDFSFAIGFLSSLLSQGLLSTDEYVNFFSCLLFKLDLKNTVF